jgi:UDP-N-acetylglucosamine 1-carboxyvinyltransferase
MSKFLVTGGKKLKGEIRLSGNKNSALKLIPATLLANSPTTLTNVPAISDIKVMVELIRNLGAKVEYKDHTLTVDPTTLSSSTPDPDLCSKIRASVVLAAPLLVRFGKTVVTPPGGDQIGDRFLDTHFSMMQKMGVEMERKNGQFFLSWKKKIGGTIFLEEASVTATEMALMMGTAIEEGVTLENAATEPHVTDLGNMLNKMGADIKGLGTGTISISGGNLKGVEHKVMPDHIEGGTFIIASAITGGHIKITDFIPEHHKMALIGLANMGVNFKLGDNSIEVFPSKLVATRKKFKAQPWPGFPTDLMSPFIVLATQTQGTVLCHDWMYEWRMFFVDDLIGMGANIFIADPHRVIISGPTKLMADRLFCKDIRAGISVILAAMVAEGTSEINNVENVERGYENIEERLRLLGADIKRVDGDERH